MKKRIMPYFIVAVTFLAMCTFGTVLARSFWYAPSDEASEESLAPFILPALALDATINENESEETTEEKVQAMAQGEPPTPSEAPLRLIIPTLEINAKVQKVGITKKGNMATPNNFTDVGWYKYGAAPGNQGSVVMAGHVDNGIALPGVFKHLGDLKEGDDIFVDIGEGIKIHYVVRSFSTYDYNAKVDEVFNENDAKYLKLITCTGEWMPNFRTHDKRLVVTAVEV
jgi:LPXTG-site transpeptidase (sortase) family protein